MKTIIKKIFKSLRQILCMHDLEIVRLSSRFQVKNGYVVQPWVCRCKKCGATIHVYHGKGGDDEQRVFRNV